MYVWLLSNPLPTHTNQSPKNALKKPHQKSLNPASPRESHQPRIQRNRQQQMTPNQHSQRKDRDELVDVPTPRDELRSRHDDHNRNRQERQRNRVLERSRDFRDLDEEVRELDFLRGGAPGHVDAEHVAEERLRDVERHAAEEDDEH